MGSYSRSGGTALFAAFRDENNAGGSEDPGTHRNHVHAPFLAPSVTALPLLQPGEQYLYIEMRENGTTKRVLTAKRSALPSFTCRVKSTCFKDICDEITTC